MRSWIGTIALVLLATPCAADTTLIAPNTYRVDAGVAFSVGTIGNASFLFNWSDDSGTFSDVEDPTLVLVEDQAYTFARTTSSHPLVITTDALPVIGSAGSYARTTIDEAEIDAVTLSPRAAFTADPAPTSDMISWTPGNDEIGDYFYTCHITFHTTMTGAIQVVAKSVGLEEAGWSVVKAAFGR